jgi:hypothetical protein
MPTAWISASWRRGANNDSSPCSTWPATTSKALLDSSKSWAERERRSDAGVPLRDVQEAASHADPRTTMRYDRARVSLDRHATYIVSTFIAGASR